MYLYLKALHIIFIVTWFAGLFYIVRLFIYNTEAAEKPVAEKQVLQQQFTIMIRRLWLGITWPSAIITAILGPWLLFAGGWHRALFGEGGRWLLVKLIFVVGLYLYHFSLHAIYKEEMRGVFKYTSQKLRIWNEVATLFLVSIVVLATVKQSISFVWALIGLIAFIAVLMSAIRLYKALRAK